MGKSPENRTFIVPVEVEQEEDGRWSAWVEALPGSAAWGHSREEALRALNEAAQAYISLLLEKGKSIPPEIETAASPVVAVSV